MVEVWTPDSSLARFIDHTLLKPSASEQDILQLCKEAIAYKFYSVCVHGSWVAFCRKQLAGSDVAISAVCGFPLGAMATKVKVFEAVSAVEDGAREIDMVLSIGAVLEGRLDSVSRDIAAVVKAVENRAIVKVILETGFLDDRQKVEASLAAEAAGAHYVKTSTGFGPGGATEADIKLMRASVAAGTGVKASGGIRD
ncbi:deoxyribose-phosphate aldolase, partial [Paenibacillus sepulcri]|nr:deoxyribose-phosphate aldolase [Paenibacillus sepulcri]